MVGSVFTIRRGSTRGFAAVALLAVVVASGCTAGSAPASATPRPSAAASVAAAPATVGTFEVATAWPDNTAIPVKYTCEGDRITPLISWKGAPAATVEFVLIMDTFGGNVSWVATGIPGGSSGSLPEALQGSTTGSVWSSYQAPCPAPGQQQEYTLILYARSSHLAPGITSHMALEWQPQALRDAMSGHEFAEATVVGWYMASSSCEVCGGTVSY